MKKLLGLVALVVLVAGCGGPPIVKGQDPSIQAPVSATRDPNTVPGSGEYLVGVDIQPGTYKSPGAAGNTSCYVYNYTDTTMTAKSLRAWKINREGASYLTVTPEDKMVKLSSCQPFTRVA